MPPYPKGYTTNTGNNLPPIPHSKSTKNMKKREDSYDDWKSSKRKRKDSSVDAFSVDDDYYKMLIMQSQNLKNSKS